MELQVLTTEDLEKFRKQLLTDIESLLNVKYPKKWLKTNEVMDLLGMSEVTLQTLRNKGLLPFRKLGVPYILTPRNLMSISKNWVNNLRSI